MPANNAFQELIDGTRREAAFLKSHQPDTAGRATVADRLNTLADAAQAVADAEGEGEVVATATEVAANDAPAAPASKSKPKATAAANSTSEGGSAE